MVSLYMHCPFQKIYINYNIAQLEMWGQHWANKRIQIFCYNTAVMDKLNSGRAKDETLATCASNIWPLTAMFNITLITSHVYGVKNATADLLSRWNNTPNIGEKLSQLLQNPIWVHTHLDLTLLNYSI